MRTLTNMETISGEMAQAFIEALEEENPSMKFDSFIGADSLQGGHFVYRGRSEALGARILWKGGSAFGDFYLHEDFSNLFKRGDTLILEFKTKKVSVAS